MINKQLYKVSGQPSCDLPSNECYFDRYRCSFTRVNCLMISVYLKFLSNMSKAGQ